MDVIDLRSDTVSHPTPAMREAMANAVVGDDVYGDDPTVNQLQAEAAEMFGKEGALLVTSGTQGNLIAMMVHCQSGQEAIIGHNSHIFLNEQGGLARIAGVTSHTIPVQTDGILRLEDIQGAIRDASNDHYPRTAVVAIENTQNSVGGVALSADYTHQVVDLAHSRSLKLHIDGARIFNAIAACNSNPKEMIGDADSLTFCLSKGLCAPAGSVLVGSKEFIAEARRARKVLGGGMRQAGILAAAGLIGIHDMSKHLYVDHENAALLAEGLSEVAGIDVLTQNTNFIFFKLTDDAKLSPEALVKAMKAHNILLGGYSLARGNFRIVTHYWITRERVQQVIEAFRTVLA